MNVGGLNTCGMTADITADAHAHAHTGTSTTTTITGHIHPSIYISGVPTAFFSHITFPFHQHISCIAGVAWDSFSPFLIPLLVAAYHYPCRTHIREPCPCMYVRTQIYPLVIHSPFPTFFPWFFPIPMFFEKLGNEDTGVNAISTWSNFPTIPCRTILRSPTSI